MTPDVNTSNDVKTNFSEGFGMLPGKFQPSVRAAIMDECGLSYISFYNRMNGIVKINKAEIPVIERIFEEYDINPWTGERIP